MSLALHLRLRGEPEAAAIARGAIGATLDGTAMLDVDLVSLVVTELIGRLAQPEGGRDVILDVHVDLNARRVRVHVTGPPRKQDAPPEPALAAGWRAAASRSATRNAYIRSAMQEAHANTRADARVAGIPTIRGGVTARDTARRARVP